MMLTQQCEFRPFAFQNILAVFSTEHFVAAEREIGIRRAAHFFLLCSEAAPYGLAGVTLQSVSSADGNRCELGKKHKKCLQRQAANLVGDGYGMPSPAASIG